MTTDPNAPTSDDGFAEPDEPVADVIQAFESAEKHLTAPRGVNVTLDVPALGTLNAGSPTSDGAYEKPAVPDLDAIESTWLRQCAACDAGLSMSCTCPPGDPRNVIANLVDEVKRLRTVLPAVREERSRLADENARLRQQRNEALAEREYWRAVAARLRGEAVRRAAAPPVLAPDAEVKLAGDAQIWRVDSWGPSEHGLVVRLVPHSWPPSAAEPAQPAPVVAERCQTCGCELEFPSARHLLDCGPAPVVAEPTRPSSRDECCGECVFGNCVVDARNGEQFTGRDLEFASTPEPTPDSQEGAGVELRGALLVVTTRSPRPVLTVRVDEQTFVPIVEMTAARNDRDQARREHAAAVKALDESARTIASLRSAADEQGKEIARLRERFESACKLADEQGSLHISAHVARQAAEQRVRELEQQLGDVQAGVERIAADLAEGDWWAAGHAARLRALSQPAANTTEPAEGATNA